MDPALEARLRALCESQRFEDAATAAVRGYGPDVYGFLVTRMRSRDRADEVFAQLGEDLWRGLPSFRWEASFSTWMYKLARHAAHRYERTPHHHARRHASTSQLEELIERVRTETRPYLKTEIKDRFAELRAMLSPEDQTLLILRVGRDMAFGDIAQIMSDEPLDEVSAKRSAAALRQRFATVKRRLRALAEEHGLFHREGEG